MRKTMKLKLVAILCAIASSAFAQSGIRQFQIVSDNLQFPAPVNVEWMQGESPQFVITAKQGNFYVGFSNGASVVLKAWAGNITTQLYANKTGTVDTAKQGKATVELLASEANFAPTGRYNYAVGVYDGTNYMGIIAQGVATVRGHPFGNNIGYVGTTSPFPYVPTNDAAFLNAITNIIAGTNVTVSRSGRQVTVNASASGGGGAGTFTNVTIGTNVMTAQAIIQPESNIVTRAAGGTNYIGLAGTIANAITFSGAINANDHIEIANTKHLRFQDGGGTNTVHLEAVKGRLIITGAVDIVSGQAVPATINGSAIATASDVSARLASNVWSVADSTTNYVRRTGDVIMGSLTVQTNFFGISKTFSEVFQTAIDHRNSGLFFGAGRSDGGNSAGITIQQRGSGGGAVGIGYSSFGQIYGAHAWFSGLESLDNPGGFNGDFAQINFTAQDGTTSTPFSIRGNWLGGSTATVRVSKIEGDGSRLTGLIGIDSGALTNLGSGLALSAGKLTATGSAITNAFVQFNLGAARNATNNGMGLARGYLDTDTATNDIFPAFFVTVSSNVVQDAYAKAWVRWPVASPTQIQLRVWYQGNTNNPLEARFSNGTNAVAYVLGAASADALNTITLTPSGFLTNVAENAAVQLRISAAFASTSSVPMGRGIEEGLWVRR
jgi:hypothetical protein